MRSALEWAQVRALAAEGLSQREIARRLGINRRTVVRLARSDEPPRYRRAPARLAARSARAGPAPAGRGVAADQGAAGDRVPARGVRLRRLGRSGASGACASCGRRPCGRRSAPATGPLRCCSSIGPRCRRGRARGARAARLRAGRDAALLGRADRLLQLRPDAGVLPRGARARLRVVRRRGARVRLRQPALGRRPPRAASRSSGTSASCTCAATTRFHASACTPATPREKGSVEAAVRHLKSGFWPARRFPDLRELDDQYVDWRDAVCNARTHASGRFPVAERLAEERAGAAAAAAGALRLVRAALGARADRRLPEARPLLLPCARTARARARRAALRPRPGLDRAPRRWRSPATSAATSRASGCRRRHAARAARAAATACCRRSRSRRPSCADYAELCA